MNEGGQKTQTSCYKTNQSWELVLKGKNSFVTYKVMVMDVNYTYYGNHFTIYGLSHYSVTLKLTLSYLLITSQLTLQENINLKFPYDYNVKVSFSLASKCLQLGQAVIVPN